MITIVQSFNNNLLCNSVGNKRETNDNFRTFFQFIIIKETFEDLLCKMKLCLITIIKQGMWLSSSKCSSQRDTCSADDWCDHWPSHKATKFFALVNENIRTLAALITKKYWYRHWYSQYWLCIYLVSDQYRISLYCTTMVLLISMWGVQERVGFTLDYLRNQSLPKCHKTTVTEQNKQKRRPCAAWWEV